MKKVLIIGGSGFIGRNVIDALLGDEFKLFLLSRNTSQTQKSHPPSKSIEIISGTLRDTTLIQSLIREHKIETVIHLASGLIPSSTRFDFKYELVDTIIPTLDLLEVLSDLNVRIIYFSSGGSIYGEIGDQMAAEESKREPISYYGYSKLIIENQIQLLSRINDLKYVIIRPSNAYGNYQRTEAKQGFIPVSLGRVLSDQPIVIWGDGKVIRDFVHVKDLAGIVKKIVASNTTGKTYNVGSGQGKTLLEIVELIGLLINKNIEIQWMNGRNVDVNRIVLDITKIQTDFEFMPTPVEKGLKQYIDWIRTDEK